MKPAIHYLNTDLDLVSTSDLTPLADALTSKGVCLLDVSEWGDGLWHARFETEEQFREPELTILAFLDVIESLGADMQRLWSECSVRAFDVGYDCGDEPRTLHGQFSTATLARIVAVGASLQLTLYAADRKPEAAKQWDW